ncbi:Forkhead box protein I2 [Thelohanellus kitauei]|uniref:Forkhead box protein I2 n=1 Tax=Thelohanellus kitauei TaxID=669202 RepID=A0A0C2N345_THEKT|nr:Forkhead box protein I2 [Thelohanellus kitauei]
MIVECMLQSPTRKVLLSEIYRHVKTNYKDMTDKGVDWQNGIRHNLSLNDCFEKDVRNPNGKGYFWTIAQKNLPFFEAGDFRRRWTQCRTRRQRDKIEKRKQSARRPMASPNYAGFNVENPPPNLNAFQNASPSPNVSSFHNKKDSNYFDRRRVCLATETAPFAINHPSPHSVPPPMHSPSFNGFYNNGPPNFFQRQCLGNFHEQNTLSPHQAYFTYPGYVDSCGGHQSPYSSQMQSSTQQGQTSENVSVDGSHRLPEQHSQDRVRTYQDHSVNTIMNRLV